MFTPSHEPYSFDQLMTLLEEGIPFIDMKNMSLSEATNTYTPPGPGNGMSNDYYQLVNVSFQMRIKLEKMKEISVGHANIVGNLLSPAYSLVDPRLQDQQYGTYFTFDQGCSIHKGYVIYNGSVSIPACSVARLSKAISDNKFFSALEQVLSDDRPTE